jgi:hypothetical protein
LYKNFIIINMLLVVAGQIKIFVFLFFAFAGCMGVVLHLILKSKRKMRKTWQVRKVRNKYLPMHGECYLYVDKNTGKILSDCIGDKCVFYDTEAEAQIIMYSYKNSLQYA